MAKKWQILREFHGDLLDILLKNRGITDSDAFLHPPDPISFTPKDTGIDATQLKKAIVRINKAIEGKESVVVYADYDADGICAGAIMWETLHAMGAQVMPYIPHRVEEGYGLSKKGIDSIRETYDPSLIITVDHGITAHDQVEYAKSLGIDVVVTDHHTKPKKIPDCICVHTITLCGSGVAWFVAKSLGNADISLAAIGTIADLVPLIGPNRSIVKFGLDAFRRTKRVGLLALMRDAGILPEEVSTYSISHMLAPRLNAMGRLVHAMDALRLLCTKQEAKATLLARKLGLTNRERQQLTTDTTRHALGGLPKKFQKKLIFISHNTYNQGVIGLVAGKLVEEYWRPAVVVSLGEEISRASARSIPGFNIINAIRSCLDLLIDAGGHPMAAGFTVETRNLAKLQKRLELLAEKEITEEMETRSLRIDTELPLDRITPDFWKKIQGLQPFGFGNPEPVFATRGITLSDIRTIGADGKHLKIRVGGHDAVAFGMGDYYHALKPGTPIDIAYTVDMNVWNGNRRLQLKIKDIQTPDSDGLSGLKLNH